ncbi:MAG: tRNA1(Val) (adenine(37)-N6)-methyltransferase [Flavisolibacter sp.]
MQGQFGKIMGNPYFQFKQFTVYHDRCAMKVTTDGVLFGAWISSTIPPVPLKGRLRSERLKVLEKIPSLEEGIKKRILDIGCGTGLLGLMVVQKNDVLVDAVEVDKEAAEQAKENVEASQWRERIRVVNEDILNFNPEYKYDVVVCNPPFYEKEIRSGKVAKDTAHHSEQLKLDQVFDVIGKHLRDDGVFYLLLPGKREKEMERLMRKKKMILKKKLVLHLSETNKRLMIEGERILNSEQGIVNEEGGRILNNEQGTDRILNIEQGIVNEEAGGILNIEQGMLNEEGEGERIVNSEVREEGIWVGDERFKELMKDYYLNL